MATPCDSRELRKHAGRLQAGVKVHTLPTLSQAHVPVNQNVEHIGTDQMVAGEKAIRILEWWAENRW